MKKKKFEYLIKLDLEESQLNELGKDGWELSSITHTTWEDKNGEHFNIAYFKREILEEELRPMTKGEKEIACGLDEFFAKKDVEEEKK